MFTIPFLALLSYIATHHESFISPVQQSPSIEGSQSKLANPVTCARQQHNWPGALARSRIVSEGEKKIGIQQIGAPNPAQWVCSKEQSVFSWLKTTFPVSGVLARNGNGNTCSETGNTCSETKSANRCFWLTSSHDFFNDPTSQLITHRCSPLQPSLALSARRVSSANI